ncbi:hypothetical protein GH714_031077 [Hevea brasiliensis]|uniref:Pentacotripeptide-repeat region of PRORP domain-containing protein n=1 Tax=Hevea brasiliensis TaxID=3981 RepID=A0A6A6M6Z1_HEVBR|nr:hypothetical protein GH714_031077 [Hevea brasiliensis]
MNFARLVTRLGSRNTLVSSFHSTTPLPAHHVFGRAGMDSLNELYRRISPVGDPKISIVPILDRWIEEGRSVNKEQLVSFIKKFRYYKRYYHALEISMWMTDKRYFPLTSGGAALRLDLISKVHGIEQVEKYFNDIPQQLKALEVYGALLNCYVNVKSVEKAEAVMQKMRDLGFCRETLTYNAMLNLYYQTGNFENLDALMHEMEENGIAYDKFTLSIRLSAFAAVSDIEGMEKTIKKMESDSRVVLDWAIYAAAASGYTKAGFVDKALEMLKKSEGLITGKKENSAYNILLTQYAATGKKDEVLRLWELYKKKAKIYNRGYFSIISALLKFDDLESAEKIFEEWESQNLTYDIRVPNFLIAAYSRKGHLDRAETFINRVVSKGGKPVASTWFHMAQGYLQNNQISNAVEMMKKAIVVSKPGWKPTSESLASCLEHLKREGDIDKAEQLIKYLLDKDIISLDVQERLLNRMKEEK